MCFALKKDVTLHPRATDFREKMALKKHLHTQIDDAMSIDRNCDVLPIEYDLLIVMLVNINITITIIVFF